MKKRYFEVEFYLKGKSIALKKYKAISRDNIEWWNEGIKYDLVVLRDEKGNQV